MHVMQHTTLEGSLDCKLVKSVKYHHIRLGNLVGISDEHGVSVDPLQLKYRTRIEFGKA